MSTLHSGENTSPTSVTVRGQKRLRLSFTCNQCRKRKVRCDESQPRCSNCVARGDECVTVDPNDPAREVSRRRTNNVDEATKELRVEKSVGPSHPQTHPRPYIHHREMILNSDAPTNKRKLIGGGTLQAFARFLDCSFEHHGWELISSKFSFGMQISEEVQLPSIGTALLLPQIPLDMDRILSRFRARLYPMIPIVDMESLLSAAKSLSLRDLAQLPQEDVPNLCCLYSIFGIMEDENAGTYTEEGSAFISTAYRLSSYLISMPYFSSVQAMLLLTVALRSRNKDGAAWQILGQGIRIAQSIGLHRRVDGEVVENPGSVKILDNSDWDARVWWTCYCLEKTMGLEVGRPVSIRDSDCDQVLPRARLDDGSVNYLHVWVGLAQLQSRIIDILYHRSEEQQNASSLLTDIGKIDKNIIEWSSTIEPEEIRPGTDLLCYSQELHLASFISILYHQTIITIHQAALMINPEIYQTKISQYCHGSSSQSRLRASETILLSSARQIGSLQIGLNDQSIRSCLFTVTQVMLAAMVLAFNIMKHPTRIRNRPDAELLSILAAHAEAEYRLSGQSEEFIRAIIVLKNQIRRQVTEQGLNPNTPEAIQGSSLGTRTTPESSTSTRFSQEVFNGPFENGTVPALPVVGDQNDQTSYLNDFFLLDHPWDWLVSDGIVHDEYLWDGEPR